MHTFCTSHTTHAFRSASQQRLSDDPRSLRRRPIVRECLLVVTTLARYCDIPQVIRPSLTPWNDVLNGCRRFTVFLDEQTSTTVNARNVPSSFRPRRFNVGTNDIDDLPASFVATVKRMSFTFCLRPLFSVDALQSHCSVVVSYTTEPRVDTSRSQIR